MSVTQKINIKEMLLQLDNFVKQFRFCPIEVKERVNKIIKANSDLIIKSNTIIQLNLIKNIIFQITEEIKNCTSIKPKLDIYDIGHVNTPKSDDELDKIASNLYKAYKKLNKVIRKEENFLTDIELIILLNFILTYNNPYWKESLDKLLEDYKIGGTTRIARKRSLANMIKKKIFGETTYIKNEGVRKPIENNTQYYFSIYRRNIFDMQDNKKIYVVQEQLQILNDMGFGKYIYDIGRRIKRLKYFLKYLVYKNKYITLKNNMNL